MSVRTHCPSCHHRLSPFAVECPVCGLGLAVKSSPRPLLFQASALQAHLPRSHNMAGQAIATPALGRVAPMALAVEDSTLGAFGTKSGNETSNGGKAASEAASSFWPLVQMEIYEFSVLTLLNIFFLLLACLLSGAWPSRLYSGLWLQLLAVHLALSWTYIMLPMALTGQSVMMGRKGLLLDSSQPDRRLTFSLFHLVSVIFWPLSFLCLVLTPNHRTLAELLTGQEILQRSLPRMR